MSTVFTHIPALTLSAEYLLGGLIRASPWPSAEAHKRVSRKNARIVPILYPVVPFRDVKGHNRWVGGWMMVNGVLWGYHGTRGSLGTLGLSLFWTSAGAYSQWKAGMPFWLPVVNFMLSWVACGHGQLDMLQQEYSLPGIFVGDHLVLEELQPTSNVWEADTHSA